ncbi:hypothetical protein [Holophaga foetida]|uniref:hypothetical protein n=1 Tax=Holophaga foetida TaxID=35839 RepID=UPI00024725F6|nr:hypothetical protein [Holophaga foetida]
MSEFIQIIEHKGKKVIFFNCAGMDPDVAAGLFPEVTRTAIEHRINLVCSDVSNSSANDALKAAAAESVKAVTQSLGSIHTALVGLKGIQRIIAQAVVKDQYFAKTREEALEYLVGKG